MRTILSFFLSIMMVLFHITNAQAGVVIGGTRLVYPEGKKEINITVENKENFPYLIKTFLEKGSIEASSGYFMITPPLFRLDAQQKSVLRVFNASNAMPADRESLFYFNVTSIPAATDEDAKQNTLQIAVRNRMKLFYRPKALADDTPENVTNKLTWAVSGGKLKVTNPTGYYMNFSTVIVNNGLIKDALLLAPFSSTEYVLPNGVSSGTVIWKIINDQGGIGPEHKTTL
ncbi:Chaperone protein FocC [Klebsiella variicola]|uniref:fimbrial biogenesis chaperone n=1 Tax=Klebsiella variicola TaxID=244366 RepID=UPI0010DA8C6C|nr:molecular chaperone [Klebsiella variicola]VGP92813.1 Chaperone protein FocC [Klebsiella variicola]